MSSRSASARAQGAVLLLSLIFPSLAALADETPLSRLPDDAPSFASAEDAAIAALRLAMPLSRAAEYAGGILECSDRYYFTSAVSTGEFGTVRWRLGFNEPCTLAGAYHTHPARPRSNYFSVTDVALAQAWQVPVYLGALEDGTIRVFDPKTMRARSRPGMLARGAEHSGRVISHHSSMLHASTRTLAEPAADSSSN
jgi:hypothetical protein